MRVLLIDDEADKGWEEVLKNVLSFEINSITSLADALQEVKTELYDLILLDLRFGESDHNSRKIEDYGGFKILEAIKSDFYGINFPTPIMLITATNKVWNIVSMLENGADSYYIKEHPDFANDIVFSKNNYTHLLESVSWFKIQGKKRQEIWECIVQIHNLCNERISNDNIRLRIEEKLKIGYGVLFRKVTEIEKQRLLFNKEVLAFIVFWSILEEISHFFYARKAEKDVDWILATSGEELQYVDSDGLLKTKFSTIKEENIELEVKENSLTAYQINLSNQICGILRYELGWSHHEVRADFIEKLNRYRNKVDFIHSNTSAILNQNLADNQDSEEAYNKCRSMLKFIIVMLKKPS